MTPVFAVADKDLNFIRNTHGTKDIDDDNSEDKRR